MRLFADENFPYPAVEFLRQAGHDVRTVRDVGRSEQAWPDREVLDHARDEGRALLTLNRKHFLRLHWEDARHAGLVLCTFDPDFAALADRISTALADLADLEGQVVKIRRPPT